jgi:hypothetical protein
MVRRVAVGALALASLAACGTGVRVDELEQAYVGTWQIASGEDTSDCGAGPQPPTPVTGSVIVEGGASPLTLSVRDTNHGRCSWILTVSQTAASFRDASPCSASTATSDALVTPRDYLLTLSSAGEATATSTFDWEMLGVTCRHTQDETLTR